MWVKHLHRVLETTPILWAEGTVTVDRLTPVQHELEGKTEHTNLKGVFRNVI